MKYLPKARTEGIVVQNAGGEILIYDLTIDKAFCLNETSARVFAACDGVTTFDELKAASKLTEDMIYLTLDELQKHDLIGQDSTYVSPFAAMRRRDVIRQIGLASMIALPVISSLVAPQSADASSAACQTVTQACVANNYMQSNCCPGLRCSPLRNPPFCFQCGTSGVQIYTNCTSLGNCSNCDTAVEKNGCCNPSAPSTNNGSACICG